MVHSKDRFQTCPDKEEIIMTISAKATVSIPQRTMGSLHRLWNRFTPTRGKYVVSGILSSMPPQTINNKKIEVAPDGLYLEGYDEPILMSSYYANQMYQAGITEFSLSDAEKASPRDIRRIFNTLSDRSLPAINSREIGLNIENPNGKMPFNWLDFYGEHFINNLSIGDGFEAKRTLFGSFLGVAGALTGLIGGALYGTILESENNVPHISRGGGVLIGAPLGAFFGWYIGLYSSEIIRGALSLTWHLTKSALYYPITATSDYLRVKSFFRKPTETTAEKTDGILDQYQVNNIKSLFLKTLDSWDITFFMDGQPELEDLFPRTKPRPVVMRASTVSAEAAPAEAEEDDGYDPKYTTTRLPGQ